MLVIIIRAAYKTLSGTISLLYYVVCLDISFYILELLCCVGVQELWNTDWFASYLALSEECLRNRCVYGIVSRRSWDYLALRCEGSLISSCLADSSREVFTNGGVSHLQRTRWDAEWWKWLPWLESLMVVFFKPAGPDHQIWHCPSDWFESITASSYRWIRTCPA